MQGASYFSNSCRVKAERVSHFTNRCRVEGVKAPERESACPASRFSRLCFSACESVLLYKGVTSLIDQRYFTNNGLLKKMIRTGRGGDPETARVGAQSAPCYVWAVVFVA